MGMEHPEQGRTFVRQGLDEARSQSCSSGKLTFHFGKVGFVSKAALCPWLVTCCLAL